MRLRVSVNSLRLLSSSDVDRKHVSVGEMIHDTVLGVPNLLLNIVKSGAITRIHYLS